MKCFTFCTYFLGIFFLLYIGSCKSSKFTTLTSEKIFLSHSGEDSVKARSITLQTPIPAPIDTIWHYYLKSRFFNTISNPYGKLTPLKGYQVPEQWVSHRTDSFKLIIHGFIPFGKHYITWEKIDKATYTIQTHEKGGFISVWDNHIDLQALSDTTTCYRDLLIIRAGILTGLTTWWAKGFYQARHKKLRRFFRKNK